MNKNIFSLSLASCLLALSNGAWAASFVVSDIKLTGIQYVDPGTVLENIPLKVGDQYQDYMTADIVRSLYKTGLFENVSLEQSGTALIVNVQERLAVGEITISGNKLFKTEQLMDALQQAGIRKGQTLSRSALARIKYELKQQYLARGRYDVSVEASTRNLARNRVAINIAINEGDSAKVKNINIIGNKAFSNKVLLKLLDTGEKSTLNFFSSRDKYSKQKLTGDLDKLTSFYQDQGYLKFKVTDTQVTLSPDKKDILITINIDEGDRYRIGRIDVSGVSSLSDEESKALLNMREGQIFSQNRLERSRKTLRRKVSQDGRAFAEVNVIPQFDEAKKLVNLTFQATEGKRVYVRRINIRGNYRTRDEVYRREIRQLESSWFSRDKVERSKVRLRRLPYVQNVQIQQVPVAGTRDQVDLDVTVEEQLSNQFSAGLGFSQSQGLLFNIGLKQQNVLGSGKSLGINANNSSSNKRFNLNFNDPYHTIDGIGRGFALNYRRTDTDEDDLISSFSSDNYGGNVNYTIPLSEENSFRFSIGYEHTDIKTSSNTPAFINTFVAEKGSKYDEFLGTVSYVHDTRDRTPFPTDGVRYSFSFEAGLPGSDLEYYKLRYKGANYWAINEDLTFALKSGVSYGDGYGDDNNLPFFERFYLGGIGSVRGFERNTLGSIDENDDAVGGDFVVNGGAELLFPIPFAKDIKGLRMSAFVDAGNVYDDVDAFEFDDIRYSAGVSATWITPFAPITLSYAKPLNAKDDDQEQQVQFSIGVTF